MRIGLIVGSALVTAATLSMVPAQAATARDVGITSDGMTVVDTYTYQDSSEGYITFTVRDPDRSGEQVSQCWVDILGDPTDCDTYPLQETSYRNGDWRIRSTSDGWEIRVYVGYRNSSEEDCMDQYRGAADYGINIAVLGSREEVLGEHTHSYDLVCRGYAAETKGGRTLTAHMGETSDPLSITYTVVDTGHEATSAQGCFYSVHSGRATKCTRIDLSTGDYTTNRGWNYTVRLTSKALSSAQCRAVKRQEPRYDYRVVFRDAAGDTLLSADHRFTLRCR